MIEGVNLVNESCISITGHDIRIRALQLLPQEIKFSYFHLPIENDIWIRI